MTTRIPESQFAKTMLIDTQRNKNMLNKYSREISTGYKVQDPGDSNYSGTISQMREAVERISGQQRRVTTAMGYLSHQDAAMGDLNDVLIRAAEIASQAANETNSETERRQLAQEVFEIRAQVISLANTQYLGRYIFAGAADDNPAYSPNTGSPFTVPGDGSAADTNFVYSINSGSSEIRNVPVTDDLSVQLNQAGAGIFNEAVRGLTELGRALSGFRTVWTTTDPPVPDNAASTAYNMPDDFTQQTQDIQAALDRIEATRETDVVPTRTNIAGRMRRLQSAESLLLLGQNSAKEILANLQEADLVESATNLTQAQTALNASLTVSTQLLQQSILDYI